MTGRTPLAPRRERRSIYLVGTSGFPNLGDELIARSWLRHLAQVAPEADVWLDCPVPGNAAALFIGEHPRLHCTDTLFRLTWDAPRTSWDAARYGRRALLDRGVSPRWSAGVDVLLAADEVHLIGGGHISSRWPHHFAVLGAAAGLADRGVPVAVTGQGFLPVHDRDEPLLAGLLHSARLVEARDAGSAQAAGARAVAGSDDAWLDWRSAVTPAGRQLAGELDVVLCLQSDQHEHDLDQLAGQVLRQLRYWDVDPARVALLECIPGVDRPVYDKLTVVLPQLRFLPWIHVWRDGLPAAAHQRWISTRFHPHLLAAAAGAWGVAISVDSDYYAIKHASLTAAGSDWAVVPVGAGPVEAPRRWRGLAHRADRLSTAKRRLADELYGAAPAGASASSGARLARSAT